MAAVKTSEVWRL